MNRLRISAFHLGRRWGLGTCARGILSGSSAGGRMPSRGLQGTGWGREPQCRANRSRWLSGGPAGREKAMVPGSVPASGCCEGPSVWGHCPGPAPGTDCCLSLPGSSAMGLTFGNHFSFFGKFLSLYTRIPRNWWVWKRGKFPNKGKKFSQM